MKLPRIFTANFEQSVELVYQKTWFDEVKVDKKDRKWHKKKVTIRKRAIIIILLCLVLQGIEWLNNYGYNHPEQTTLPIRRMNFLPPGSVFMGVLLCLTLRVIWEYCINFNSIKEKKRQIIRGLWFTYAVVVGMLWILTDISGTAYFGFIGYMIIGWLMLLFVMFMSKKRAIEETLFGTSNKPNRLDKFMNGAFKFCGTYGLALVGVYQMVKFIFPEQVEAFFNVAREVSDPLYIFMFLLIETIVLVYSLFPTVIQIFYHVKYSEELRELEGKSQLEWYGEKYFLKHIKGTEREK